MRHKTIPVYNSAPYLELCLESVLLQKDVNLEFLLVNDSSTDYSDIICQEYANKYQIIRYFQKEPTGAAASRNLGIGFAEGEYLFFLDSDDYLLDGTLKNFWMEFTKQILLSEAINTRSKIDEQMLMKCKKVESFFRLMQFI